MRHVVRKAYFDFEKEEQFLNEMSAKGWALVDYSWCKYVFEDTPKGEYIYRLELLEKPLNHPESQKYIQFMQETGVEYVASYNRWVYFRKKAEDGKFQIYSDLDSRIRHYKRVRLFFSLVIALNLLAGLLNTYHGFVEISLGFPAVNSYIAIVSYAAVALLLIFLVMPLNKKISYLEREKGVRE